MNSKILFYLQFQNIYSKLKKKNFVLTSQNIFLNKFKRKIFFLSKRNKLLIANHFKNSFFENFHFMYKILKFGNYTKKLNFN